MNELIKISKQQINEETVQTVDARELHQFLEVRSEFRNWIKNRIADFEFTEGIDFIAGNFLPGSEQKDYFLTLDMAKELSMVERNQKGKQARQYFIECERVAKQISVAQSLPQSFSEALRLLADQVETADRLMKENQQHIEHIAKIEPAAKAHELLKASEGSQLISDVAKDLGINPQRLLFHFLADKNWIFRKGNTWRANQKAAVAGVIEQVPIVVNSYGHSRTVQQVRILPKGIALLAKHFAKTTNLKLAA